MVLLVPFLVHVVDFAFVVLLLFCRCCPSTCSWYSSISSTLLVLQLALAVVLVRPLVFPCTCHC